MFDIRNHSENVLIAICSVSHCMCITVLHDAGARYRRRHDRDTAVASLWRVCSDNLHRLVGMDGATHLWREHACVYKSQQRSLAIPILHRILRLLSFSHAPAHAGHTHNSGDQGAIKDLPQLRTGYGSADPDRHSVPEHPHPQGVPPDQAGAPEGMCAAGLTTCNHLGPIAHFSVVHDSNAYK